MNAIKLHPLKFLRLRQLAAVAPNLSDTRSSAVMISCDRLHQLDPIAPR